MQFILRILFILSEMKKQGVCGLRVCALRGLSGSTAMVLGWVHSRKHNFLNVRPSEENDDGRMGGFGAKYYYHTGPETDPVLLTSAGVNITDATIHFENLGANTYWIVRWWDTETGALENTYDNQQADGSGNLDLVQGTNMPTPLEWDLALTMTKKP